MAVGGIQPEKKLRGMLFSGLGLALGGDSTNFTCRRRQKVYFSYRMEFEYDPAKSARNESKHGVNFEQAKGLWFDEDRLIVPARGDFEERWALLGKMEDKLWVMFYTHRGDRVRIISVRRARPKEEKFYESGRTG